MTKHCDKSAFMNNDTLPQLEQLIDQLIAQNQRLNNELSELKEQNSKLIDENETLQLEVLESEEKQKDASNTLSNLLEKLQSATQAS
jgi:predicted  nucleic acid-binding Zn-ribbon protein